MDEFRDWMPLLVGLLAAAAALGGQWLAVALQAGSRRRDEWRTFQRQAMVDLQDALVELYRLVVEVAYNDIESIDPNEERRKVGGPLMRARVAMSRIDNKELRSRADQMIALIFNEQVKASEGPGSNRLFSLLADIGSEIRRNHVG